MQERSEEWPDESVGWIMTLVFRWGAAITVLLVFLGAFSALTYLLGVATGYLLSAKSRTR